MVRASVVVPVRVIGLRAWRGRPDWNVADGNLELPSGWRGWTRPPPGLCRKAPGASTVPLRSFLDPGDVGGLRDLLEVRNGQPSGPQVLRRVRRCAGADLPQLRNGEPAQV